MSTEIVLKALDDHGKAMEVFRAELKSEINHMNSRISQVQTLAESNAGYATNISAKSLLAGGIPTGGFEDVTNGDIHDANGRVIVRGKKSSPSGTNLLVKGFTDSQQFNALVEGANSTGRVQIDGVHIKALTNAGQGVAGSTGYEVQPQRDGALYNDPRRTLTLLDVLPSLPVSSSSFEYVKLANYVNTAAFQTEEGQQKAESNFDMAPETANIATIAHWTKASVQVLGDEPALGQRLLDLLQYGVLSKLESEIVAGAGGTGKIKGLIDQGTMHAAPQNMDGTPMEPIERIGHAVTELKTNGWQPGVIILNPADWFIIATIKATDKQYIMGSPREAAPLMLWDVPVVLTPSLARNSAIVLDTKQVAILDRQAPTLAASREDGQNFTSNMVTLLGELRAGLAVFAPGAVLIVDITPIAVL